MTKFKDIPGYEGYYQINNTGQIKSLRNNIILKGIDNGKGYKAVYLYGSSRKRHYVHRLVMITFIGKSNLEVNHKNGIKYDNRLINLEYCTKSENELHKYSKLGYKGVMKGKIGKLCPNSIKIQQFNIVGKKIKVWDSAIDIKRKLKIDNSSIIKCCKGKLKLVGGFRWEYFNKNKLGI